MPFLFKPLPTADVRRVQAGGPDAYGQAPERAISEGDGVPCRHCLKHVAKGEPYLILAWRPFSALQPYAETGPIFLHAETCEPVPAVEDLPEILSSPDYIVRGYSADERIVYGTGAVTPRERIAERAKELFADARVNSVHIRSARNNCYQCRVVRVA